MTVMMKNRANYFMERNTFEEFIYVFFHIHNQEEAI